jgi:hypothetical protein
MGAAGEVDLWQAVGTVGFAGNRGANYLLYLRALINIDNYFTRLP